MKTFTYFVIPGRLCQSECLVIRDKTEHTSFRKERDLSITPEEQVIKVLTRKGYVIIFSSETTVEVK